MPRILLLMPTKTYRARAFLRAANRLGFQVTVGSDRKQALEDLTKGTTLTLDFLNFERAVSDIAAHSKTFPLDAIVPVDEQTAVLAAEASRALNLNSNTPASARFAGLKHEMRKVIKEADEILSPNFIIMDRQQNRRTIAQKVHYPCVLKPVFLSSSRGVIRANDPAEFLRASRRIEKILQLPEVAELGGALTRILLVEDYINGREVVLEGLLTTGELKVLTIFDKPDPLEGPFFEETIYVTPSREPTLVQNRIAQTVALAAKTLGLRHGSVHAELRVDKEQRPWLIEIAARSIGGICSESLSFDEGMTLEEVILKHAVGEDVSALVREELASGVMMIPIPCAGILRQVGGLGEAKLARGIKSIVISIPIGQTVAPLPEGNKYLGFIFATAETTGEVVSALREAHNRLHIQISFK